MDDKGAKYYYSRLSDSEKIVYTCMSDALLAFEAQCTVRILRGSAHMVDVARVINAVLFDNPVFFYVDRRSILVAQTATSLRLQFDYIYSPTDAKALWHAVKTVLDGFVAERITPEMKPLSMQIEAHRWLQQNVKMAQQPYDASCFSVVGALVRGSCVCEGFAKAYKLLCDRMHIASMIVTGTGIRADGMREAHAWNITRIDGVTAHIDTTWDAIFGVGAYDYFNLSDKEISVDHLFAAGEYPVCADNHINYFALNGLLAPDIRTLRRLIALHRKSPFFSVKLRFSLAAHEVATLGLPCGSFRINEAQNIMFFSK